MLDDRATSHAQRRRREGGPKGPPRSESPAAVVGTVERCQVNPTLHAHPSGTSCPFPRFARSPPAANTSRPRSGDEVSPPTFTGDKVWRSPFPAALHGIDGGQSVPVRLMRSAARTSGGRMRARVRVRAGPCRAFQRRSCYLLCIHGGERWDLSRLPRRCSMRTPV